MAGLEPEPGATPFSPMRSQVTCVTPPDADDDILSLCRDALVFSRYTFVPYPLPPPQLDLLRAIR